MDLSALLLTLRLATVTMLVLVALALPLAAWLASTRWRGRALLESLVALPIVLPPTVIGYYLLVLLGPTTGLGRALTHLLGHPLAFSFSGLVVGSVLYSLPFAVQPMVAGFAAIDPALLEAAAVLGSNRWRTLMRIRLPLARGSVLAAAVLTFAHTVGEFGVVLMIGGNLPGQTRTLSIALYDQVQDFSYAQANHTAWLLLGVSFAALLLLYSQRSTWLGRRAA